MGWCLAMLLVGVLVACGTNNRPEADTGRPVMTPEAAAVLDDSVRQIVERYEGGETALTDASRELADLLEPTGGLAVQGKQSPRATELFAATGRELRRRDAKWHGVPDSPVTK